MLGVVGGINQPHERAKAVTHEAKIMEFELINEVFDELGIAIYGVFVGQFVGEAVAREVGDDEAVIRKFIGKLTQTGMARAEAVQHHDRALGGLVARPVMYPLGTQHHETRVILNLSDSAHGCH